MPILGLQSSSQEISSQGVVRYPSEIFITVDSSRVIGVNRLSLGFMLDHEWKGWRDSSVRRELASNASFKLVHVFDYKTTSPRPCIYWNESTMTGTFSWTDVDLLVHRIFEIGAEPMFTLGGYTSDTPRIPPGMAVNPGTNLPYPESFAAYASEWVKHFKEVDLPVRYYQIIDEPFQYFGWVADMAKLANYVELFNTAARKMRKENPNILLSHSCSQFKRVLDYWVQYGEDLDFFSFYKYDSSGTPYYNPEKYLNDEQLLTKAEQNYFIETTHVYGVRESQQVWRSARGKALTTIDGASNINSAWSQGTDPRIQQMVGAVWNALVLRMGVLYGLQYNVYFSFSSSASSQKTKPTGGYGFGMINSDNNEPWYPYYVYEMFGDNLRVGDSILETNSTSDAVRSLAWIRDGRLNVLLVSKIDKPLTVTLHGLAGKMSFSKIDNTISWETPSVQHGSINSSEPLVLKGYTVVLLQTSS